MFPGNKVQGTFTRSRPVPDPHPREPIAEELGANLTCLLNSNLTASSQQLYQRAWVVFRQFYAHLYGSTNPLLPLPLLVSLFLFRISRFVNWPVPRSNHIFLPFPMHISSKVLMTLPTLI